MTARPPPGERPSGEKAQAPPAKSLQRPSFQNRAISAPAGGLYRLIHAKMETDTEYKDGQSPAGKDVAKDSAETSSNHDFSHVTIAVVGGKKVGKSTFLRRALEMKNPPSSQSTTKKMAMDDSVYIVRLLEIDSKDVASDGKGGISWPRLEGDQAPPTIDGVLVLHDATQPATLSETSGLLDSLAASTLPYLPVACKCDLENQNGQPNPVLGNHENIRTSLESSQSPKTCIAFVLRSIINSRYDPNVSLNGENHQNTPGELSQIRPQANPAVPRNCHHARANSETPAAVFIRAAGGEATTLNRVDGNGENRDPNDHTNSSNLAFFSAQNLRYGRSNSYPIPQTPPSRDGLNQHGPSPLGGDSPNKDRDRNRQQRLHSAWRYSAGSDAFSSFLDMEDEMDEARSTPTSPSGSKDKPAESVSSENSENGLTFDELVDRLVAQPMSKQESKFASVFLCLYRKFAAPSTLLNALISRFEKNENNTVDQLTRIADQLRLLTIIAQWASEYPGDFTYPRTRKRITDFVSMLEKSHFYMFAAKEIGSYLGTPSVEDDDVGWPFRDGDAEEEVHGSETFFDDSACSTPSPFPSGTVLQNEDEGQEEEEDPMYSMNAIDFSDQSPEASIRLSGTLSTSSSTGKSGTTLNQSLTSLSLEAAQKEAQLLDLRPRIALTKVQWRQFMEIPDEDFARELTRIDWIMYNSFRPRDLVRHVSISGPDKEKVKSLHNVSRMIRQFNHLAFFVASMILLRDKPKHRAKALEKFMNIALRLRRQNNYNSLGAVIAGINGTPVHRLTQTKDLVPQPVQKEFMRLVILMGTQKSHFAYRLAWDNSPSERIPFLPLHRRDLVSAEEGNKTFVGDNKSRINWKKFEVMGEVVLGIQRSQKTPYAYMYKSDDVLHLVLGTQLSGNEEDLYARSLQVEPAAGGETGRRKFGNWLSRNVLPG